MHHGQILKRILQEKNIRQTEYAKMIGFSDNAVSVRIRMQEFTPAIIQEAVNHLGVDASVFPPAEPIKQDPEQVAQYQRRITELQEQIIALQDVLLREKDKNHELSVQCAKLEQQVAELHKQMQLLGASK